MHILRTQRNVFCWFEVILAFCFFLKMCCGCFPKQIKPTHVGFRAHVKIACLIVSYHNNSEHFVDRMHTTHVYIGYVCWSIQYYYFASAVVASWRIVSLCYVPDGGTLGCRETLHVELKDAQGRADGTGPGFLSGVCDSTGILLIMLTDSVSRWHR